MSNYLQLLPITTAFKIYYYNRVGNFSNLLAPIYPIEFIQLTCHNQQI